MFTYFARACVRMCDFKFVDWANFLLQPSNGQTYGRSPVCILTCVLEDKIQFYIHFDFELALRSLEIYLRLKSNEKRLPQPSNVH